MTDTNLFPEDTLHFTGWEPAHDEAAARLAAFVPRAGKSYAKLRNFDFGPEKRSNISALSPWIRHRLLLEETVLEAVLDRHSLAGAEKFIQEVFWRGYFKGWLEQRPLVWQSYKQNVVRLIDGLDKDAPLARRYDEAISGRTGIDCFDAWTRELIGTGYLHNHARMWCASIWIYTLQLPWELGADFFYRHLLDGDPASNTCSWRWVGGLHTIGKTYLARASNIEKFTDGRFNPAGQLAADAPALPGGPLPERTPIPFEDPKLQGQRVGLVITEEDCSPHNLPLASRPVAAIALDDFTPRSTLASPEHVQSFASKAVKAASEKFSKKTAIEVSGLCGQEWDVALADWSEKNSIDVLVTARLPRGPVRRRLLKAVKYLSAPLVEITRDYDRLTWPHAKAGFFGLKKKIPKILGDLKGL